MDYCEVLGRIESFGEKITENITKSYNDFVKNCLENHGITQDRIREDNLKCEMIVRRIDENTEEHVYITNGEVIAVIQKKIIWEKRDGLFYGFRIELKEL